MIHPTDGLLRRYLDEPAAMSDADRSHLSGCSRCLGELGRAGQDRDLVARALASTDQNAPDQNAPDQNIPDQSIPDQNDVDQAWVTLRRRLEEPAASRDGADPPWASAVGLRRRPRLIERAVRRPVTAAVAAGLVVLGGAAAAAASDWLPIFRAEKVAPVTISDADLTGADQLMDQVGRLAELSAYGDLTAPSQVRPSTVPDAAAAAARTGLTVPAVADVPTGVQGAPRYLVLDQQNVEFTFSAAKAGEAVRTHGGTLATMPAGLDGTRLRVQGGPGVAVAWQQQSGMPTLVVARAKAPTAATQGAPLPVVRDYLLSMPGISPGLAAQLRAVTGDGTTLPIPVPSAMATSSQTDVDGVPATVIQTKNGLLVGVVWVDRGELNVVLGPLSRDEVLKVARDLR